MSLHVSWLSSGEKFAEWVCGRAFLPHVRQRVSIAVVQVSSAVPGVCLVTTRHAAERYGDWLLLSLCRVCFSHTDAPPARPLVSHPLCLLCAATRPEAAGDPGTTDWDQLRLVLLSCGTLLLEAVNAASSERAALQQEARGQQQHAAGGEAAQVRDWMATEEAFEAWNALSSSCVEVKQHLGGEESLRLELAAGVHLPAVRCLLSSGAVLKEGSSLNPAEFEELAGQQLDSLVEDADLELQGLR